MTTQRTSITEQASQLDAEGRIWLEKRLGRPLRDDEEITIVARSLPDPARRAELARNVERLQQDVEAYQKSHGIRPEDATSALDEAVEQLRNSKRS